MIFSDFFKTSHTKNDSNIIFWLCWMFFFWGISSSMVFTLLPVFIIDDLGGTTKAFGLLEGSIIFLSFIAKLSAGFIMDIFKKKKPMLYTGAVLTVLSKLFIACSFSVIFIFVAKSIDRIAKGLRHAPIDAIIAELSSQKGFAYSLKYMMNILGSLIGSVFTYIIIINFGKNFRLIFFFAVIPTIFALWILKNKIKYQEIKDNKLKKVKKWNIKDISLMPYEYWQVIILVSILMFNRFSEGFMMLKAKEILPDNLSSFPIFMAIYEICVVLIAIPTGKLSDKLDKKVILLYGIILLIIADIFGIFASDYISIILMYIFSGIHMGMTQGVLASIIAKSAPESMIGTAFAIYYGVHAITLFISNYIAGISNSLLSFTGLKSASSPFIIGVFTSCIAVIYIYKLIKKEALIK